MSASQPAHQQVIVTVVFGGDLPEVDVDRAAFELERAGYRVTRLPDKLAARLDHPLDDFLEAFIEVDGPADNKVLDGIMEQVSAIVDPYGGDVAEWGLLEPDHVPVRLLLAGSPHSHRRRVVSKKTVIMTWENHTCDDCAGRTSGGIAAKERVRCGEVKP